MSIVLNEYEWAEKMLENNEIGRKPSETLSRISKYYLSNKYSKKETRRMLDAFLLRCDPNVSLPRWSDLLDRIVKNSSKYPLIMIEGVAITDAELAEIEKLKGVQMRRLAFTLLCVAKYWNEVSPNNGGWVNCPDREIMQMANINTSVKRQSAMFGELRNAGLIKFSRKVDNLNVRVVFIKDGETEMFIRDFRNLGYQYLRHCGGSFFECANCGLTLKFQERRGRPQKYCANCAVEVKTKQSVEAVMRRRHSIPS